MPPIYPNGGYRNKTALELSMPTEATPPAVTGNRPDGSGYSQGAGRGSLSALLRAGRPQGGGGPNSMQLDLRGFVDANANSLDWQQRDRLNARHYGTPGFNVELDLKPNEYRVNGRGALMRQAVKIARQVLRGGKRLPKNVYKDLVLTILEKILDHLAQRTPQLMQGALMLQMPTGWSLRGYDPAYGVPEGSALRWQGEDPNFLTNGELITLGSMGLTVGAFPASAPNPPVAYELEYYGGTRYATAPIGQFTNIVVYAEGGNYGPSKNVKFMFSLAKNAGATNRNPIMSKSRATRLAFGSLTAPYTRAGSAFNKGGEPVATKTDFPFPRRDIKMGATAAQQAALGVAMGATEAADFIDSIYDALPPSRRYGRSYKDKLTRIMQYWNEIDWGQALGNVIYNHFEDKAVGRIQSKVSKQLRSTSLNGMTYQYGVTQGGGSTPYYEINLSFQG